MKTLLFSCRAVGHNLAASSFYEFEDLIAQWMGAEIFAPAETPFPLRRKLNTLAYRGTKNAELASAFFSPTLAPKELDGEYDLIFALLLSPDNTYLLSDFKNLRESAKTLACYIPEVWAKRLRENPHHLKPLEQCDHIFVSTLNSVETLAEMTGRPVHFLPFGVDALKFSPAPHYPARAVDVMNIGRRSPATHQALRNAVQDLGWYYQYDTVASIRFIDAVDHRLLYANMAKRSKYFISNTANFDQLEKTGGAVEIGHRFYEGAAGGAVLLGYHPEDHPVLRDHFDWPDAVIYKDHDAPNVVDLIQELEAQPERVAAIRAHAASQSLRRHDFVYRWAQVLDVLGLAVTGPMRQRKAELDRWADDIMARSGAPAAPSNGSADTAAAVSALGT